MDHEVIRTLKPFSDLKIPTNTIYDHLPYKKDITLIKESDVRLVSGNIVKSIRLVPDEPVLINTNPLANDKIEKQLEKYENRTFDYVVEEYSENELTDTRTMEPVIEESVQYVEPVNSFAGVDEDDEDYSFLLD